MFPLTVLEARCLKTVSLSCAPSGSSKGRACSLLLPASGAATSLGLWPRHSGFKAASSHLPLPRLPMASSSTCQLSLHLPLVRIHVMASRIISASQDLNLITRKDLFAISSHIPRFQGLGLGYLLGATEGLFPLAVVLCLHGPFALETVIPSTLPSRKHSTSPAWPSCPCRLPVSDHSHIIGSITLFGTVFDPSSSFSSLTPPHPCFILVTQSQSHQVSEQKKNFSNTFASQRRS